MNVLSLCDGIGCGRVALERANIPADKYYASEIDKWAISVSTYNYPDIIQLGDMRNYDSWGIDFSSIDLVMCGFPCQAWSVAGKQMGDRYERGALFWCMLDIMKTIKCANPNVHFLIENVKMKAAFEQYITHHIEDALGTVHKILINSALVSAQNRNRYYWTSWENTQPEDKHIYLKDIVEDGFVDRDKPYCINANYHKGTNLEMYFTKCRGQVVFSKKPQAILATLYKENAKSMIKRNKRGLLVGCAAIRGRYYSDNIVPTLEINESGKTNTLTTVQKDNYALYYTQSQQLPCISDVAYRKHTPLECERLQTLPDGYTSCVSNTQRYHSVGNGWTVDAIAHLLCAMPKKNKILKSTKGRG